MCGPETNMVREGSKLSPGAFAADTGVSLTEPLVDGQDDLGSDCSDG